jgi:hypothetical protein
VVGCWSLRAPSRHQPLSLPALDLQLHPNMLAVVSFAATLPLPSQVEQRGA